MSSRTVLFRVALVSFIVELCVMISFHFLPVMSPLWVPLVDSCLLTLGSAPIIYFWIIRPLNRRLHRAVRHLEVARDQAHAANTAKTQFLANMSHEIRTPMTAILGFTEQLTELEGDPTASEQRLDAIDTVRRNGEHLLTIINDILDLSKIEAEMMTVEFVPCSPTRIIADVLKLLENNAFSKGLVLTAEYVSPIPQTMACDPTRLRQMLMNLIGNSLKFTENGCVRVEVGFDKQLMQLSVDVIDTGIGMSPEQVKQLFRPFAQADSSMTRRFGGTGLGLTISKRLAEAMGGDIVVVSTVPGRGAHFRITVTTKSVSGPFLESIQAAPCARFSPIALPANETPEVRLYSAVPQLSGRVLVAEDGVDNQKLISFLLRKAGLDVTFANDGKVALDLAWSAFEAGVPFDVLLTDMQMPLLSGYELATELRKRGYPLPIIAATANAMSSDRNRCISAGCDDYVSKPIKRDQLFEVLGRYLNKQLLAHSSR